MANRKWIVTDMDDTMIKCYGKPSNKVRELWNLLSEDEGNCLVVATGQSHIKVIDKFLVNGLTLPKYVIANQGTIIYNTETNKVLKAFCLTYSEVEDILDEFIRSGGKEEYIRVCLLDKVIVFDTPENRSFYARNYQSNIEFSSNLWDIIKGGLYTKLVLSAPFEVVEKMVKYSAKSEKVTLFNSGGTKFGKSGYYRFEIVASDKKIALKYLLSVCGNFSSNTESAHIIGLGDEVTDYGLAEVVLSINCESPNTGHFAIINSSSNGNIQLKLKVESLAKNIRCEECLIFAPKVELDGWATAITNWQEKINKKPS